jgi:D-alanine-D-alanine ligase
MRGSPARAAALPQRALVAHTAVAAEADASTADVLDQAALFAEGLAELGIPFATVAVPGGRAWEAVPAGGGAVVCNLLEAPPGRPHLHTAATAALELLDVPFTGCAAGPMWLTTDKLATRALLAAHGLPVAPGGPLDPAGPALPAGVVFPVIVKPGWEDASVGLEGNPVCAGEAELAARAWLLAARFPDQPLLVEAFLPGREFNISVLEAGGGPEVMPVAEIAFVDFPPGLPPLVGYEAKWEAGSFADTHTVRRFPAEEEDGPLLAALRELARRAWQICGMSGYARVDMRLDRKGVPCILEVNANPCLSADAGFMAAATRAGLGPAGVVRSLLEAALRRHGARREGP